MGSYLIGGVSLDDVEANILYRKGDPDSEMMIRLVYGVPQRLRIITQSEMVMFVTAGKACSI